MIVDLLSAAQNGTIQLLREQLPPAQRGMARHSLLENAQPPFHLVGDIDSEDSGGKSEQLEEISVDLHTVYRGGDRGELLALMHQARLATDRKTIVVDGAHLRFRWLAAAASTAGADGVTYAGLTKLHVTAEPA